MRAWPFVLVAALPGCWLSDEVPADACAGVVCSRIPFHPAVTLTIVDDLTSAAPANVAVTVLEAPLHQDGPPALTCGVAGDVEVCQLGLEPGRYALRVGAPGYVSQTITVDVTAAAQDLRDCCQEWIVPQSIEVRLVYA